MRTTGIGIDFGTTNSSVAVVRDGHVVLARYPAGDASTQAYRSVLYFDPYERGFDRRPLSVAGPPAIESYLAGDVDRVFMTGGSSLVPAVRAIFAQRFGDERLAGGEELTSVASGLALRAADAATRG